MIRLALAAGWTLQTVQWIGALLRAGSGAAASGEWAREVAIRAGMVGLVIAAIAAPSRDWPDAGRWAVGALVGVFFAGHALAIAGRSALGEAWSMGTRFRSGGLPRRRGLYGTVRHPIYAGTMLAAAAQALLVQNAPALILFLAAVGVVIAKVRAEERWLRASGE